MTTMTKNVEGLLRSILRDVHQKQVLPNIHTDDSKQAARPGHS